MIVVDSSVWIDFFNGKKTRQTDLLDDMLGHEPILVGDLIMTEVLQGFKEDADFNSVKRAFEDLFYAPMVGQEIAIAAAKNYRKLRRAGVTPRKTIDVLIATFCIENHHSLLHADRDFDSIEAKLGLVVV